MKEDYCSYEVAKLLKEKGFDVELQCYSYNAVTKENADIYWQKNINGLLPRCTHQMAMKWLREEHLIHIMISIGFDEDKMFYHPNFAQFDTDRITYGNPIETDFSTYEEAVEVALKYTLENLI